MNKIIQDQVFVPIFQIVSLFTQLQNYCSNTYGTILERQQFPLKLAWSTTIHKAQGLTLNDIWVDLGPSEKAAGLTYVALTRVRSLSSLIIEPMPYERLTSLKKSSNYKYRVLEEIRLSKLNETTISKFQN